MKINKNTMFTQIKQIFFPCLADKKNFFNDSVSNSETVGVNKTR